MSIKSSLSILDATTAKDQVFAHWKHLERMAQQKFPTDENLGHEAMLFILQKLETDQWQRIRSWQGKGEFIAYLTVIASRLLIDFSRQQYGHQRKPVWIEEKKNPFWDQAYHLLIIKKYSRQECIEILCCSQPQYSQKTIEKMVTTINQKCTSSSRQADEDNLSLEMCAEPETTQAAPDQLLDLKELDLLEILLQFLNNGNSLLLPERLIEPLHRLQAVMLLSEEDRLLLQLRYVDGFTMKSIIKALNYKGDLYKRYHKLILRLRQGFKKAGLIHVDSIAI